MNGTSGVWMNKASHVPTYPLNSAGDYCGKQKHGKCESNSFLTSIKFALYGFVAVASAFLLLVVQKVLR
jgi:hypothetical protein